MTFLLPFTPYNGQVLFRNLRLSVTENKRREEMPQKDREARDSEAFICKDPT
jgi:hypothetical protein